MPGGDGTGPAGLGRMTGRAAGYCAGYSDIGTVNPGFGRGYGLGYGRSLGLGMRRGHRGRWAVPYTDYRYGRPPFPVSEPTTTLQQEIDRLERQAEYFTGALQDIKQRIDALDAERPEE